MVIKFLNKLISKSKNNEAKETTNLLKEKSELDFWINIWDKNIRDNVLKKNKILSAKDLRFQKFYEIERIKMAKSQLDGILWMAKKPKSYLKNKIVVEIGPGCNCALEVSDAAVKIAIEPLAQQYMDNNLLLKNNRSTIYLNCGSELIPLLNNYSDIVIASNCLDHVENLTKSISEIYRILKIGGELFINLEIDHEPTNCEPYSLKYQDLKKIFYQFKTNYIKKTKDTNGRVWVRAVYMKSK